MHRSVIIVKSKWVVKTDTLDTSFASSMPNPLKVCKFSYSTVALQLIKIARNQFKDISSAPNNHRKINQSIYALDPFEVQSRS